MFKLGRYWPWKKTVSSHLKRATQKFSLSMNLHIFLRNSTPGGYAYIWQSKSEIVQIHFSRDVFAVVAVVGSERGYVTIICCLSRSILCWRHFLAGVFTHTQNSPVELWRRYPTFSSESTDHHNVLVIQCSIKTWKRWPNFFKIKSMKQTGNSFNAKLWSITTMLNNKTGPLFVKFNCCKNAF